MSSKKVVQKDHRELASEGDGAERVLLLWSTPSCVSTEQKPGHLCSSSPEKSLKGDILF